MSDKLLEVKNYSASLSTDKGTLHILNGISFEVGKNECFGIIGESGCGKSMTAMSILRYGERIGLKTTNGDILFNGEDVLGFKGSRLKKYNGGQVSIIMQDPMTALDPLYRVDDQIIEAIRSHQKISKKQAREQMKEVTALLSITEEKLKCYPHELSGGLLQRIVGAMAVCAKPELIIADEPTTALDVTIQLQYLKLLKKIQKKYQTSIIFISHDIKVVSMMCDRIAVMYAGRIVESGTRDEVFENPQHPYTKALLKSSGIDGIPVDKYETIDGYPPNLREEIKGCPFADRCPYTTNTCISGEIPMRHVGDYHEFRCIFGGHFEPDN